jgi:hypothetical protein
MREFLMVISEARHYRINIETFIGLYATVLYSVYMVKKSFGGVFSTVK